MNGRFFLIITRAYDPKAYDPKTYDPKTWEPPGAAQSRASLDLALIALMRDAMLRRSEAAAARWRDLQREPDGTGRLTIPVSKVDQVGKGEVLFVSEATMECLDTMLHYRDGKAPSSEDTIFGIGGTPGRQPDQGCGCPCRTGRRVRRTLPPNRHGHGPGP